MLVKVLKSKIHRATVTGADLDYLGSLTIDADLMEAAGLAAHEALPVADLTNGSRHTTYAIPGRRGSGEMCVNGAAAHLVHVGDQIIVMSFGYLVGEELAAHRPKIVLVDERNRPVERLS